MKLQQDPIATLGDPNSSATLSYASKSPCTLLEQTALEPSTPTHCRASVPAPHDSRMDDTFCILVSALAHELGRSYDSAFWGSDLVLCEYTASPPGTKSCKPIKP